jgi:hypothetical protein
VENVVQLPQVAFDTLTPALITANTVYVVTPTDAGGLASVYWYPAPVPLPAIGEPYLGGFYAGLISLSGNGVATHALVVADKSLEQTNLRYKGDNTSSNAGSSFDGAANTANTSDANHNAAHYCANLVSGGYDDWYLPAILELDVIYANLKPSVTSNVTNNGSNAYAVPARSSSFTASVPGQTVAPLFQDGGAQAFSTGQYLSSSQSGSWGEYAQRLAFSNGSRPAATKITNNGQIVRPVRRVAL